MLMEFVRVEVSARGFGGFADLLLETLERAGVNIDAVTFEGVPSCYQEPRERDGLGFTPSFLTTLVSLSSFPGTRT
ncbi:unnamed protein product [Urochloa humidicola]